MFYFSFATHLSTYLFCLSHFVLLPRSLFHHTMKWGGGLLRYRVWSPFGVNFKLNFVVGLSRVRSVKRADKPTRPEGISFRTIPVSRASRSFTTLPLTRKAKIWFRVWDVLKFILKYFSKKKSGNSILRSLKCCKNYLVT